MVEGDQVDLGGVDAWSLDREATGRTLRVPHPQYPAQQHRADVFRAKGSGGAIVTFAVAELSNGVYAFFRPTEAEDGDVVEFRHS